MAATLPRFLPLFEDDARVEADVPYRRWLEAAGVDTSLVKQVEDKFTASFFCSTDTENNQIASFYTGAMADAGQLSFWTARQCGLAIIAPNAGEVTITPSSVLRLPVTVQVPLAGS